MLPSSPRSIGVDPHHPPPHRSLSMASPVLSPARALGGQGTGAAHRQSMVGRSYRDDPETARERQMQQDIESAMSMCTWVSYSAVVCADESARARSGSLAADSPPVLMRPSHQHFQATSPIDETPFPMLSEAEEAEMNRARSSGFHDHEHGSDEGHHDGGYRHHEERGDEMEAGHDHRSTDASSGRGGYDAHAPLLRRHSDDERHVRERRSHGHMHMRRTDDARSMGGMGMRNTFDFGAMEEFAAKEQGAEGGPGMSIPPRRGSAAPVSASYDIAAPTGTYSASAHWDEEGMLSPKESDVGSHQAFARRRQRKLSASNPVTRRGGKLALFEGFGGGDGEPQEGALPFKAPRQARLGSQPGGQGTFQAYTDAAPGHDKPYRFSFYSNALPVTIHARSLAELPAEGQSFEDLFKGRNMSLNEREADGTGTDYAGSLGTGKGTSGYDTPDRDGAGAGAKMSMLARAAGAAMKDGRRESVGGPGGVGSPDEQDPEAYTWWLDVQSPTDEEMRMLSKVGDDFCSALTR
jgi:magnesium transporter